MSALVAKPSHGQTLTNEDKAADVLQLWFDELETQLNMNVLGDRVQLPSYQVADLPPTDPDGPSPSPAGGQIFISDESGGAVTAFSDGTNWLRSTDRMIVS